MIRLIQCEFIKNFSTKKFFILLIVLTLTCFALIQFESFFKGRSSYVSELSLKDFNADYEKAKKAQTKNPTLEHEAIVQSFERMEPIYKRAYELVGDTDESLWQHNIIFSLFYSVSQEVVLEQLLEYYQDPYFNEYLDTNMSYPTSDNYGRFQQYYYNFLDSYKNSSKEELTQQLEVVLKENAAMKDALDKNSYYLFVKAEYEEELENANQHDLELDRKTLEVEQYIIDHQFIDEKDFRVLNAWQFLSLSNIVEQEPLSLEDYSMSFVSHDMGNYKLTKRFEDARREESKKNLQIVEYAFQNEVKHDAYLSENVDHSYLSSKNFMNMGLHLGFVIVFLSAILHAGIVSKEHDSGTIKLLLTKPVRRGKILFSKFLYLILDTYLLWLLASFLLFLIVGFRFGFEDLFTAKLVVSNGKVIAVNYFLWYLKELFICGIPVCCFLSILFSLSTLTLNTSLTASVVSVLSIFSITVWSLISQLGFTFLSFLSYTPIPYLDYFMVRYKSDFYMQSIMRTTLSMNYGFFISIVVSIILVLTAILVYTRRDVKN